MATVQCMVHETGRVCRNRPAFLGSDIRILYGELDLMVSATAQLLRAAAIQPGQRVAIYMESGWACSTLILALLRIGAVACPLNTRLPVAAVKEQLDWIACDTLIARIRETSRKQLPGITTLDPDGLVSRELTSGQIDDSFSFELNQPAVVLFTSGSSGTPKAVQLTYGNLYYSAYGANQVLRLQSEDCWHLSLPLYHVGGLGILFRCLQSGAAMSVPDPERTLAESLPEFPVTHVSLVSTQLKRLLDAELPAESRQRFKAILLGGDAVPEPLFQAARSQRWPVLRTYGLTEMAAMVTACSPIDPPNAQQSSGKPLRYRDVKITGAGEICVRGATRFSGYVEGNTLTTPFDQEGWFHTGDLGQLDDLGYLHVIGRKDNQFTSGGENIQPETIERVLLTIPGVQQAIVRPQPDPEYGQRPIAYIQTQQPWDAVTITVYLRNHLPGYMIPDDILPWPDTSDDSEVAPKMNRRDD